MEIHTGNVSLTCTKFVNFSCIVTRRAYRDRETERQTDRHTDEDGNRGSNEEGGRTHTHVYIEQEREGEMCERVHQRE